MTGTAHGIAVDSHGDLLIAGRTNSDGWVSGGFDTTLGGERDAFVMKLDSAGMHQWSTYLGGPDGDRGIDVAVDASDDVFVTGSTYSADWVSVADGWQDNGFDLEFNGDRDGFVAKLSKDGEGLWATYVGGDQRDAGRGIVVDDNGNALVTGLTNSDNSNGWVSGGFDLSHNGGYDAFVAKLSPHGGHVWSSYLGGANSDSQNGVPD